MPGPRGILGAFVEFLCFIPFKGKERICSLGRRSVNGALQETLPLCDSPYPTVREEEPARSGPVGVEVGEETIGFSRKEQALEILRFARGEMLLHWAIAIPFLILSLIHI